MKAKSKRWNSILSIKMGNLGLIGIIVRYDDYFDCYTDTKFNFNDCNDYNIKIINSLKYKKLNNRYNANPKNITNNMNEQLVFEEFARPIWHSFFNTEK